MKRKHSRQRLVVVAFLLLVVPAAVWSLLLALGLAFSAPPSPAQGVDLNTAKKFGPIIIEHVRQHGGEDLVDKIKVALRL
jgi:hypothetical protein